MLIVLTRRRPPLLQLPEGSEHPLLQQSDEFEQQPVEDEQQPPEEQLPSQPAQQLIGSAYLYLAPVAYGVAISEWVPIVNYRGESQGELRVHLMPESPQTHDPESLLGKPVSFRLSIEAVRGLMTPKRGCCLQ